MKDWTTLADEETIDRTIKNLRARNIDAILVSSGEEAKKKVLELLPPGAEVMTTTSRTLDETGITSEINDSGKYVSVRKRIASINDEKERREARRKNAAVQYVVGSVNALTQDGQTVMASFGGSQLPYYAATAEKVIWVVGSQKIVKDLNEAFDRIREHALPLESERLRKAYGMASAVNKILIIEKEVSPGRIMLILVPERLGF